MISILWQQIGLKVIEMITVCKDCNDRFAGCHSTCEKYIEAKKVHDMQLQEKYKRNNRDSDYTNFVVSNKEKVKKRKRK